jgi:DNA-binding CsgD family transcriptional regulator
VPFDAKSVRGLKRVAWSDYITLCENMERLAGGGIEDLFEASDHQVDPEIRGSIGAIVDSKLLLRWIITIANPIAFQPVEHRFEDLGGRRVRVTVRLRVGARHSETWFRGSTGALRGVPRYLELPPAEVSAQIGPDFGIYDMTLPPNRTIFGRIRDAPMMRLVLGREHDGKRAAEPVGELGRDPVDERLHAALVRWKLTRRQLEVLRGMARGESNEELAHVLECTEVVIEMILAQLLQKTGATSRADLITRMMSSD